MQSKSWTSLLFAILLTPSGVSLFGIGVSEARAASSDRFNNLQNDWELKSYYLPNSQLSEHPCQKSKSDTKYFELSQRNSCIIPNSKLNHSAVSYRYELPKQSLGELGDRSEQKSCFGQCAGLNDTSHSSFNIPVLNSYCKDYLCNHPRELGRLYSQVPANSEPDSTPSIQPNPQPNSTGVENPENLKTQSNPPQLEGQPSNFPKPSTQPIEQILDQPQADYTRRLEKLQQLLRQKQPSPASSYEEQLELGLRVRQRSQPPLEQAPPPPKEKPVDKFKPVGYLQGRIGYFHTNNVFSSDIDPIEDGLMFYGLTLASAYLPLNPKTYINGSIDGYLIRYGNQSIYDYNQLRFNLSLYRQLSQRMYGEVAFSNQQLFYAKNNGENFSAGDRFLNESSVRLSLGRRDPLNSKLMLDSFYELSVNFADPESRNRIINSFWVSLSYYLQKPLQVGINYQLNLSNFTQRPDARADTFHRLFGHINYRVSDSSSMNLQGGVTFGGSTVPNIDYDGWFFSLNYSWDLGQF
ncbi:hypothetical protein [Fortiea contorta]|uniref:hypothetical protein n=1 Tax=Fortiea contorta TaxID=1892405 RepID=UPI00034CC95A|nr:hypothetical protein [Fortiea contorta]